MNGFLGRCSFFLAAALVLQVAQAQVDFDGDEDGRGFNYSSSEDTEEDDSGLVQVITPSGKTNGETLETFKGLKYFSFKGIPYAEPPTGKRRFQDPVPKKPWKNVLNATEFGAECVQQSWSKGDSGEDQEVTGEEDCLFLNVYTPRLPKASGRIPSQASLSPVIVYIHGGGFSSGSSNDYTPDLFMSKEVVLVTLNYRLGLLGFLSLGNQFIAGNQGLKDQLEAFKWVNANILSFGGDPSKVTILGGAQGGVSTLLHQMSPLGTGLYHGVIAMSGMSNFAAIAMSNRVSETMGHRYVQKTKCDDGTGIYGITECLMEMSVDELYSGLRVEPDMEKEKEKEEMGDGLIAFMPTVDDFSATPFMPRHPDAILRQHQQKDLPLIAGITQNEGAMNLAVLWDKLDEFNKNFTLYGPKLMYGVEPDQITEHMRLVANVTKQFYSGAKFSKDYPQGIIDMLTDLDFLGPLYQALKLMSQGNYEPIYFYEITHAPAESFLPIYGEGTGAENENWGITHGDDQFYLFGTLKGLNGLTIEEDETTSEVMLNLWTNFAKYQDPSPYQDGDTPEWKPFTAAKENYLEIKPEPENHVGIHPARMLFLDRLIKEDLDLSLAPLAPVSAAPAAALPVAAATPITYNPYGSFFPQFNYNQQQKPAAASAPSKAQNNNGYFQNNLYNTAGSGFGRPYYSSHPNGAHYSYQTLYGQG